jgi:hypothetical protein
MIITIMIICVRRSAFQSKICNRKSKIVHRTSYIVHRTLNGPKIAPSAETYFMKSRNHLVILSLSVAVILCFAACSKKEASSGKAHLQVYLTDAPASYDQVLIDVQDIRINYSSDTASGWQSLSQVNTGTYDILRLVNDQDTLLANADLNPGRIQQIRLILGDNNYVKVNGQLFKLETPSAQQSGLKLNIHQDVNAGVLYQLLLDFDAARSIVKTGNNKYILKPVIRTSLLAVGGSIRGFVLPSNVSTAVFAIQGTDTVAGTYTSNGAFLVKGLNAGSYNLSFVPSDTPVHHIQTRPGVTVTTNNVTVIDTVRLQ